MLYFYYKRGIDRAGGTTVAIVGELMEVILYVQDMGAQVSFYRDVLGLEVKEPLDRGDWTGVHWVELETGSCTLALHVGGQRRLGADAPKIVFRVSDVPAARQQLVQRGVPMGEIRSPAPGVQVADGVDLEGNRFSIESRGSAEP
jgi:predicted enzyme related to lactoylglutathione lyase